MTRSVAQEIMKDEIEKIIPCIAVPSSGNEEQDEARAYEQATTLAMMASGYCPNGCGLMREVLTEAHLIQHECPKCHFSHL